MFDRLRDSTEGNWMAGALMYLAGLVLLIADLAFPGVMVGLVVVVLGWPVWAVVVTGAFAVALSIWVGAWPLSWFFERPT